MNAPDVLKYGHLTLLGTLDGLPEDDWHTPDVCGVWSVKDIVAHLASYEVALVAVLNSLLGQALPAGWEQLFRDPAFNDDEVARRQDRTPTQVFAEYQKAHVQAMDLIDQIPVAKRRQAGTLPWYGEEYDVEDFLAYAFYGHKREHSAQIAVFKDRLAREAAVESA